MRINTPRYIFYLIISLLVFPSLIYGAMPSWENQKSRPSIKLNSEMSGLKSNRSTRITPTLSPERSKGAKTTRLKTNRSHHEYNPERSLNAADNAEARHLLDSISSIIRDSADALIDKMIYVRAGDLPRPEIKQKELHSFIGVGDIMLGTDYPSPEYLPPDNQCDFLMRDVYQVLNNADVTFGNLEGAFSDTATVKKNCNNPEACYAFRTPKSYFKCIKKAGFDLLSLANNHAGDLGKYGKKSTVELIEEAGMKHAGLLSNPYSVLNLSGIRIGFCAFSPNKGTCSITDLKKATELVKMLDEQSDMVVVSFHGGAEGADYQNVTRNTEIFYNENRGNVYEFAHAVIDAGADIVFGHGPHVMRAIEVYKERFIAYSLGNFCTYKRIKITGINGIAPIMRVHVNSKGEFKGGQIIPVYQTREHGTRIDPLNRAIKVMRDLTIEDFPNSGIIITKEGYVYNNGLNKSN